MAVSIGGVSSVAYSRNVSRAQKTQGEHLNRIGSGKRINKTRDDAAGLAIAKQLLVELSSSQQAGRNIDYGVSQSDIADGALEQQHDLVARMRELAVQASSATLDDSGRGAIQEEFSQLQEEVGRIAETTEFNGNALLQGGATDLQVGTGGGAEDRLAVETPDSGTSALGLDGLDLSTAAGAQASLDAFDAASETLSENRANIGAMRNRLTGALEANAVTMENIAAAASRIQDTDIAAESSELALSRIRGEVASRVSKHEVGLSAGMLVDLVA
ncbi:MAG: flagellin FliC [Myxococcales bacterium]|nr:flagellin FliC [Myxococcales bacterium]